MADEIILGWDGYVESDSDFTILDEGDYDFRVEGYERTTSKAGKPMAKVQIRVSDPNTGASTVVTDYLVLVSTTEWKISQFFRGVGLKKHGERCKIDFDAAISKTGRCHVIQDGFLGNDGKERFSNKIDRYYDHPSILQTQPIQPQTNQQSLW